MESASPEALAKDFADSMCGKMVECQTKQIEKLPGNVRELAKGQMMTEAKCRQMAQNPTAKPKGTDLWKKLTPAEKELAVRCMKAMPKASCDAIMKNAVAECMEWQKVMKAKEG